MSRQKKPKILENDVKVSKNDNGDIILSSVEGEELETTNLTEKILELQGLYSSLKVSVGEFKPKAPRNTKPVFKYECKCGKVIKSEFEDLGITCKNCESDFIEKE